jgi:hypothetical protein
LPGLVVNFGPSNSFKFGFFSRSSKVVRETYVGTQGELNLGVFWPCMVYKRIEGKELASKVCTQYVHGSTTYKGIVRDAIHGNPTGTILLTSKAGSVVKKLDCMADSRTAIRGAEQVCAG